MRLSSGDQLQVETLKALVLIWGFHCYETTMILVERAVNFPRHPETFSFQFFMELKIYLKTDCVHKQQRWKISPLNVGYNSHESKLHKCFHRQYQFNGTLYIKRPWAWSTKQKHFIKKSWRHFKTDELFDLWFKLSIGLTRLCAFCRFPFLLVFVYKF